MADQKIECLSDEDQKLYQLGLNFPGMLSAEQYKKWSAIHIRVQSPTHSVNKIDFYKLAIFSLLGWLLFFVIAAG